MDQNPAWYEFRLCCHLGSGSAAAFPDMEIDRDDGGETVMRGPIVDQAALHGVLMKIRDLGLPLIEVKRIGRDPDNEVQE